jgi:hypothetical protein
MNSIRDRAYNVFLDRASEFVRSFRTRSRAAGDSDSDGEMDTNCFSDMAFRIRDKLMRNIDLPYDDPLSPLSRYGRINDQEGDEGNMRRLARDLMLEIQEQRQRSTLRAFFHSRGVAREDLEEILDEFWVFSAACRGYVVEDNDENDENDEDDEDDEEESVQSENTQQEDVLEVQEQSDDSSSVLN